MFNAKKAIADIVSALVMNNAPQNLIQDTLRFFSDESSPTTSQLRKKFKQSRLERPEAVSTPAPDDQPPVQEPIFMKTLPEHIRNKVLIIYKSQSAYSKSEALQNILTCLLDSAFSGGTGILYENKLEMLRFLKGEFTSDNVLTEELDRLGLQIKIVLITDLFLDEYLPLLEKLKNVLSKDHGIRVDVKRNAPRLIDILRKVNHLELNVESLDLGLYFRACARPDTECQEEIKHILKRCSVRSYEGAYVAGMSLPSGDTRPHLSVATSSDYQSLSEELHKNKEHLGMLCLCLNKAIVASEVSKPLPCIRDSKGVDSIVLLIPDIDDVEATARLVKSVMPPKGKFWRLFFPRCGIKSSKEKIKLLVHFLKLNVRVGSAIFFPSSEEPINLAEKKRLQELAENMGASGGVLWGGYDIDEW